MIVLVGSRWGWVPNEYKVPDKTLSKYEWLQRLEPGHSITSLEVLYGILNQPHTPLHAFAYIRDPSFQRELSSEQLAVFQVTNIHNIRLYYYTCMYIWLIFQLESSVQAKRRS